MQTAGGGGSGQLRVGRPLPLSTDMYRQALRSSDSYVPSAIRSVDDNAVNDLISGIASAVTPAKHLITASRDTAKVRRVSITIPQAANEVTLKLTLNYTPKLSEIHPKIYPRGHPPRKRRESPGALLPPRHPEAVVEAGGREGSKTQGSLTRTTHPQSTTKVRCWQCSILNTSD